MQIFVFFLLLSVSSTRIQSTLFQYSKNNYLGYFPKRLCKCHNPSFSASSHQKFFKRTDFHLTRGDEDTYNRLLENIFDSCKIVIASQKKCYLLTENIVNCNLQGTIPVTCSQKNIPFTQSYREQLHVSPVYNFIVLYTCAKEVQMSLKSFQHFGIVTYFFWRSCTFILQLS